MHREEESVESEGKDQKCISQKVKRSERGEGEDTEEMRIHNSTLN